MMWSDEDIALLVDYVESGRSSGDCAAMIDRSRNACIGKALRLGLRFHSQTRGTNHKPRQRPTQPRTQAPILPVCITPDEKPLPLYEPPAPGDRLSVLDLSDKTCKWPLTDGRPHEFCGARPIPGKPYCEHHCSLAYVPKTSLTEADIDDRTRMMTAIDRKGRVVNYGFDGAVP